MVRTERRLVALYLLTVADIRGPSPKVWNAWKGKLLEDLYRYTVRALGVRVEDTFLIDGPELQQNRKQIEIETELLEAVAA